MMKRVLSFLLCVAIVVTMLPVQTIAMDEMTVPTEAVMESMEETATPMEEETTVPAEVETQPVEETTMPTEEALVIEEIEPVLADASEEAVVVEPFNRSIELYASTYGESGMAKFLFTPEVTAVYEFRSNSYSDSGKTGVILNSDGEELARNTGEGDFLLYCELIAGQTYTLTADYTDENYTGEFSVILTRIHDLPLGELVESEITTGGETVTYLFTPEETATYDFHMYVGETWGRARINDSQYNVIVSDYDYRNLTISCEMEAGETYIIESEFYYYDEVGTIPAYLTQVSELELGVEMEAQILLSDHESRYTFTPEETDIYAFHGFNADDSIEGVIYDSNGNHLGSAYGSVFTAYYQMQAGETYTLIARYDNYNDYGVYSVRLSEVPELPFDAVESVALGEPGETAVYKIAVDQTERYSIAAEGSYSLDVTLRSAEDGYLGCDYRYDGTKAEVVYTMEAGENYIFSVEYQDFGWTGTVDIFASVVHEYEEESSVAPSTCTTPGQRVFTCIHCGEEIAEEIPAAHEYDDGACIHCDEPYIVELHVGYNVYEPEFSYWEVDKAYYSYTPNYTESYTFYSSTGGDTIGYLYDSEWNLLMSNDDDEEGNLDFAITYTLEAGKTYYVISENNYMGMGIGFGMQLTVNHDFETVKIPSTCTVDGKITSTCKVCGFYEKDTIDAEHSWNKGVVTEEYSCEMEGTVVYTCYVCGETRTESEGGYGHDYYDSIYCLDCGKIMEDEGICGDNLTWKVDSTQTLTISGTGAMYDYESYGDKAPWTDYWPMIRIITIEEGVTSLGNYALCSDYYTYEGALKPSLSLTLPDTLISIGEYAFAYCPIDCITIPASVESIAPRALDSLDEKTVLKIDDENKVYTISENAELLSKDGTILYGILRLSGSSYMIPDGITTIAPDALDGYLSYLQIPDSVQIIPDYIFANCMNSYDSVIRFMGDAPSFGDNAFAGESEWDSFDGKVMYPGDNATWTEEVLQNYGGSPQWYPISGNQASGNCGENLEWTLDADGTLTITGSGPMDNFGYDYSNGDMETYIECPWEEYKNLILKVVLPDGISKIGNQAFYRCQSLRSIIIPDSVTSIGDDAFEHCENLTEIEIPDSVQELGNSMFLDCENLVRVKLPEGITFIPDTMFGRCRKLTEVNIPDTVTRIESAAFSNCNSLEEIVLPDGVTFIGYWAFQHCWNLKEINMPAALKVIDSKAFRDCPSLAHIDLPEGLVTIADGVFYDCISLTEIDTPSTVKKIGWGAFAGCTSLTEVTIPDGVSYLGGTFWGCNNLTSVSIPDSVTSIAYWAFMDCTSLQAIELPDNLKTMGDGIFYNSAVTSVTFTGDAPAFSVPDTVTDDTYGAFMSSEVLAAMEAPDALQPMAVESSTAEPAAYSYYRGNVGTFGNISAVAYYPGNNATWTKNVLCGNYGGDITWARIGAVRNQVALDATELMGQDVVWIDGEEYQVNTEDGISYVDIDRNDAETMTLYTYGTDDGKEYPVSMKVWTLENDDGFYTATRQEEFDDILQYAGSSIRVTGKKGIRMITAIDQEKKKDLITDGLAGYTLKEYGTVIAWASQINADKPLVLGKSYVKSNYAYKQGVADPIFAYRDGKMQYTNVLVNFSDEQCKKDIAMRPYMILTDGENDITLYGGIVERSIGYIAAQNAYTFDAEKPEEKDAHDYIWNIILYVYGEDFVPEKA